MKNIKIIIADDHPIFRKGLVEIISEEPGFSVLAEAPNGEAALNMINLYQPEVAVLDIHMPVKTGFEVVKTLRAEKINVNVIFLTMHKEDDIFNRAMDLGVRGYVLKDSAAEDLIEAIYAASDGKHYVSAAMSEYLLRRTQLKTDVAELIEQLTSTEKNIVGLIALNYTSTTIAGELNISIRTVENHRSNICKKLNLKGSNALLKFALEHKHLL